MANPISAFDRLRDNVFRYYGTPYRLAVPEVESERHELFDHDDGVWREPWVESINDYELTGVGFEAAVSKLGSRPTWRRSLAAVSSPTTTSSLTNATPLSTPWPEGTWR